MVQEPLPTGDAGRSICPWCSASYIGAAANCPSCGATLVGDGPADASLPGLTAVDPTAIVRAKEPAPKSRNRLLSWISGAYPDEGGTPADAGAVALPDVEVRREILRLELEAEVAKLQAEAGALIAEAAAEGRAPEATPEDAAAAEALIGQLRDVSNELGEIDVALDEAPLDGTVATMEPDLAAAPDAGVADDVPTDLAPDEDARPA